MAAGGSDGSLRFDTGINTDGFKKGTSSIKRAAEACAKAAETTGRRMNEAFQKSTKISSLENQIAQVEEKIRQLNSEMEEMGTTSVPTEEYKDLLELVEKTQMKLDGLLERQEKLDSQGVKHNSARWKSLQYDIDGATKRLETYKAELQDTVEQDRAFTSGKDSSAYKKKAAALDGLNNRLYVQKQRLMELMAAEGSAAAEAAQMDAIADSCHVSDQAVIRLTERIKELKDELQELEAAGIGFGYQEYDKAYQSLTKLEAELAQYKKEVMEQPEYVGIKDSVVNAIKGIPRMFKAIPSAAASELKKVPGIAKKVFGAAGKTVSNFGKMLGKGLANKAKQAVSSLNSLKKPSNGVGKSILKLSNMFKLMLIRMAMRAAVQGVKEGMENLVQYSDSANQSMSSLMSSMTYLKNSFAAAFSPILSIVTPVLDTLTSRLAAATGYINQFFSALGGGSTFVRAVKTNEDYAKSLKSTGAAAKSAGKDAKKALAPFDDLVQIQQQSVDDAGGGTSPADMFETVAIEDGISNFANTLKEMFSAGDWAGIGQLIGGKVNEAVQSFTDYISWDNVGGKITSFVTAFTTMFNNLVSTIDWYSIGVMMGTGVNTLANTVFLFLTQINWQHLGSAIAIGLNGMVSTIDWAVVGATIGAFFQAQLAGLYGFVSTVDWAGIGAAIATGLMGMINQIDWPMLGLFFANGLSGAFEMLGNFARTFDWTGFGASVASSLSTFFQNFDWAGAGTAISDTVIGLLDALVTFLTETDWWAFGEGVATALENIDWATVANRLFAAIGAALGAIAAVIGGLISDGVTAAREYFQDKIEGCGGSVVKGIFKGIIDGMKAIGAWIQKNVFSPFMNAFKNAFGIHSPSTVMAEMGQYLWEGFCNGIKEFFSSPATFIKKYITDPFVNGIKSLLGIHSPSTVLADIGSNTVAGFNQGVTKEQAASQNVVQSWAKGVASWFSDKFGIGNSDAAESKKWATSIMSGFNNTISQQYTKSQAVMERWAESVRKWFVGSAESQGVNEASWKKYVDNIIKAFADEITRKKSNTQKPVETWAENVRKWFVGNTENQGVNETSWKRFAENVINAFKAGMESGNAKAQAPMKAWAQNVREWFWGDHNLDGTGGMYAAFYNMAKRINEGFSNGISDFAHMARRAIRNWAEDAMDAAREEFDINSPSKEFHTIAEYVVRGFDDGINAMVNSSQKTVQRWLDKVMDVFDGAEVQLPIGISTPDIASYLPRIASGTVVPPRAGEMSTSTRSMAGYGQEEALGYLAARIDDMISRLQEEEGRPVQIVMNLTGNLAALARVLRPELDREASRKGVSLVITGGV